MRGLRTMIVCLSLMTVFTAKANTADIQIRQMLSGVKITAIKPAPIPGLYEVTTPKTVFYVDKSARFALFGHLYNLVTRQDMTAPALNTLNTTTESAPQTPKVAWEDLPHEAAITQGPKAGAAFAVFLDPDCPYCRQLAKDLDHQRQYRIEYYLMPLDTLHPGASTKSQQILCSQQPIQAMMSAMAKNQSLNTPLCQTPQLNTIEQFAKAHQFYGTPILVRRDGALHMGYLPPASLSAWLNEGETRA